MQIFLSSLDLCKFDSMGGNGQVGNLFEIEDYDTSTIYPLLKCHIDTLELYKK